MAKKTVTVKIRKGEQPEEWTGTDWWTQEDWDKFNNHVEELKANGEYLQEDEITITYDDSLDKFFTTDKPFEERFTNFGFLMPKDHPTEKKIHIPYYPNNNK